MTLATQAVREAFDSGGVSALIPILESEQQLAMGTLLRVAQTPAEAAMQDYERGKYAALEDVITLFRDLTKV
jgi:hypothetical protein